MAVHSLSMFDGLVTKVPIIGVISLCMTSPLATSRPHIFISSSPYILSSVVFLLHIPALFTLLCLAPSL